MEELDPHGIGNDRVPHPDSSWGVIAEYAHSLGEHHGLETEDCRPFASECLARFRQSALLPLAVADIRRCLYGLQRIHHWSDSPPEADELALIRLLVTALRHAGSDTTAPTTHMPPAGPSLSDLLGRQGAYRRARLEFLTGLGVPAMKASNRDPLAEFSEVLSASLHDGTLAGSRTQQGFDVVAASGEKVQVKYLANPRGTWINGHVVQAIAGVDLYDLVLFEDLTPIAVLSFPLPNLAAIGAALQKRHGGTDRALQITQANVARVLGDSAAFEALGMRIASLPRVASD